MKYWKRVNAQNITTTVESYSHDLDIAGAIKITKEEFDTFIASLPLPTPSPDVGGFRMAILTLLGLETANNLASRYPVFIIALNAQNWSVTLQTLDFALSKEAITQKQYDDILGLAKQYHIPL
jgi:hypothetical protein